MSASPTRGAHATWRGARALFGPFALLSAALAACGTPPAADPAQALAQVPLAPCRPPGEPSTAHVTVVFAASGEAQSAIVDGGPWVGTPTARCIEARLLAQRVRPFEGPSQRVARTLPLR